MGEEGAPDAQRFHRLDRSIDGGVRGMRLVSKGVQEDDVEVAQQVHGTFGDLAVIGEVGGLTESETVDGPWAVQDGDGKKLQPEEVEGLSVDEARFNFRNIGRPFLAVKDVRETAAHGLHRVGRGIDGDIAALPEIEGTDVIQSHYMVGMSVGEDHGSKTFDAGAKGLSAEIGRGVDQDVVTFIAHQD